MVNEQYERAKKILSEHMEGHNKLAQLLIDKEVIFAEDVERISVNARGHPARKKSWLPKKARTLPERKENLPRN